MSCEKDSSFGKLDSLVLTPAFYNAVEEELKKRGFTKSLNIILREGNKIDIVENHTTSTKDFTISYFDAVAPLGSLSSVPASSEYGIVHPIGTLDISGSFTEKTYDLKSVIFNGIQGQADFTKDDLDALLLDDGSVHNLTGMSNELELGVEDTTIGNMVVTDTKNQSITVNLSLGRQHRWYWGITTQSDLSLIDYTQYSATGLGNTPSQIEADVGNGAYVWVAAVTQKIIRDTTLKIDLVGDNNLARIITPVTGYNKEYQFVRTSELLSGGTVKLLIE